MKISAQALVFAGLVVSVTGLEASVRGENVSMTSTDCRTYTMSFSVLLIFGLRLIFLVPTVMTITINDYR